MKQGLFDDKDDSLTAREQLIMKSIWDYEGEGDVPASYIQDVLRDKYGIPYERSTIATFLLHLREKNYLDMYKKGAIYYYIPLINEKDYANKASAKFAEFWFDGSAVELLNAFSEGNAKAFTPEKIKACKKALDAINKNLNGV